MLQLLKQIESISSCRNRDLLGASVVSAIYDLLQPCQVKLFRLAPTSQGPTVAVLARIGADGLHLYGEAVSEALDAHPQLQQAYADGGPALGAEGNGFSISYPLGNGSNASPGGFVQIRTDRPLTPDEHETVECFLHFYRNYIGLLDYSELDTLTGLLNRKTFDEAFDKMLAQSACRENDLPISLERRGDCSESSPHWLAVVDIDHFKRVNDTFGHLFGDEVLLRIASLMRNTFRMHDRLFRFGGEEFVVMLRIGNRDNAAKALSRLRHTVENHEFPQVGQVTCSIGFTAVDPSLAPTDILGQADEALYFAKEHGRNQVCCYESLLESGHLAQHDIKPQQPEIDIDALFA